MPLLKAKVRITDYCGPIFPSLGSKNAVKKAIKEGRLYLNNRECSTGDFVQSGDIVELRGHSVRKLKHYDYHVEIVFQDDHLMIVNKPGGIASNGNRYKTIENVLVHANSGLTLPDALPRPLVVHRIDVPTCGLLMLARSKSAMIKLNRSFQRKLIEKRYCAVVHGTPPKKGTIQSAIKGKDAVTKYETIRTVPSRTFGSLSFIEVQPLTGRTHQIRIHLKELGHPIVGDKNYLGQQKTILGKGLLLCAASLQFQHPHTGEKKRVNIEPPAKFHRIMDREEERFKPDLN